MQSGRSPKTTSEPSTTRSQRQEGSNWWPSKANGSCWFRPSPEYSIPRDERTPMNRLEFIFRRFFKRRDLDRELHDELASHIAMEVESRVQAGESDETARVGARKEFGNIGLVIEVTRSQWGFAWVEQVLQDTRYAVRSFARIPLFSAIVILTLALGIGSSTTIFSLLDAILLRALPLPESNRLVMLWELPPDTHKPK